MTAPAVVTQPDPGTPPPAVQPVPPAVPPGTPPVVDTTHTEPSWLKERLEREARTAREAILRELGYSDAAAAKKVKEEHETLKKAADEQRKASLSEVEREKEARTKAEKDLVDERAKFSTLERQSQLNSACAQLGVKNTDYAAFLFNRARDADATASATAVLTEALKNEQSRAALGAAVVPVVTVPPGDTAPPGGVPAPAPSSGGVPVDVAKMTPTEWGAYKLANGIR